MAVFLAFSDESSVGNSRGEFLVGGYIANEVDWPWIARAWQERVLDPYPRIPYLHMREIRDAEWRRQHGLSWEEAAHRIAEACQILEGFRDIVAVVSTIQQSDLNEVFIQRYRKRKNVPVGLREPDYFCFVTFASHAVGQVYRKWSSAERLDFVVSRKKGVTNHVAEFKDELKKLVDPRLSRLIGDLIPASMEDRIPLQCADVLLWHVQRYYASGRDENKMDQTDRLRLAELIHEGNMDGHVHVWKRADLDAMAKQWISAGIIPALPKETDSVGS